MLQLPLNPDLVDAQGTSALMEASSEGHVEILSLLLEAGGDTNLRNSDGECALILAARSGHVEIVRLLDASIAAGSRCRHEHT